MRTLKLVEEKLKIYRFGSGKWLWLSIIPDIPVVALGTRRSKIVHLQEKRVQ